MWSDRDAEALARFRKAMEIDPGFARSYEGISKLYQRHGRLDLAIPWAEKAASIDPGNPQYPHRLARLYLQLGDEAQTARWLARALEHHQYELYGQVQELAATSSRQRGDDDAFEMHARKAAENWYIRWLVISDLRRGDYVAARARIIKRQPDILTAEPATLDWYWDGYESISLTELAYVLQHTGETTRAREILDRSQAYFGEVPDIRVVAIHALRGEVAQALVRLREDATIWSSYLGWKYLRDVDPRLESIRDEPEFKAFFAGVEAEVAAQRARLAARPKDAPLEFAELETLVAAAAPADELT
jgi:tetratricopeptide (TPR) repeat protein